MATLLMHVTEVFEIRGRGSVLAPGVSWDLPVQMRVGQVVEFRRPDGLKINAIIRGIEHLSPNRNRVTPLLFDLPKSEIPVGTEIWTLDQESES